MLEKPDFPDDKIIACLRDQYGVIAAELVFLPLGADRNTAVYRVVKEAGAPYFVKLRSGVFDEMTVIIPQLLHEQGVEQIIPPLPTRSGKLYVHLDRFHVMLYRFVEGYSGFESPLSNDNWIEFGRALKAVHSVVVPSEIEARLQHESYSAIWRQRVREFQQQIETTHFADPIAAELAAFLRAKERLVSHLVNRAEKLASVLQEQSLPFILCHSDIHVGNLLIEKNAALYIVDWDNPIMAPKERDLMFVGAGIGVSGHGANNEKNLFYQGYGATQINPIALVYYRYERIAQDIVAYCEQLLLTDEGGEDRKEGLRQLTSQFDPYNVIDMAYGSERDLPPEFQSPKP
jgi:spectinomycin phosphotransferase